MILFLLLAGFIFLIAGAEVLVRGASRLASALGIPPLIIGLTVVAYGTSAPELAVSVMSARAGQMDLAVGNVVGSNIFNVLFILGLSALIAPLSVTRQLVKLDVPLMIGVSLLLFVLAMDGAIDRWDGLVLFLGGVGYTVLQIVLGRKEKGDDSSPSSLEGKAKHSVWGQRGLDLIFIGTGLLLLVLGSRWLVDSCVEIARYFGISELIIGLTIIAAGTSLPEVATSIIASLRGERDIAVGNVVGSNLFNILIVLGLSSLVSAQGIEASTALIRFDLPVMIAVALACLPIFITGGAISRWEGFLFFAYYIAYTLYLVLKATEHDSMTTFSYAMSVYVIPLTLLTFLVVAFYEWKQLRRKSEKRPGV